MSIKDKLIGWLGGYTSEEYLELQEAYLADTKKLRVELEGADKVIELKEAEITSLQSQIKDLEGAEKVATAFLKVMGNPTDKIRVNGMVIDPKDMPLKFVKGNPVEVAVYDKDGNLYPSLEMEG